MENTQQPQPIGIKPQPAAQIAVNVTTVLIENQWFVQLTIADPLGLSVNWITLPANARALADVLKQQALECATKIVPPPKPSLLI